MYSNKVIGANLKKARESKGFTLQQVADLVKLNKSTIYRYETGEYVNFKFPILNAIAQVLDVKVSDIIGEDLPWESEIYYNTLKKQSPVSQEAHERTMYALDLLSKLSPEKREEALRYLDYLVSQDKK